MAWTNLLGQVRVGVRGSIATPITQTLLLDTYSGAAAAYSLRKLSGTYSGSAIRVRRSSDNTEQNIGFNADGTLNTLSLLAFVGSGNGFVTTWYDQSGNGRNLTQLTSANQPSIILSGSINTQNNKPVLITDGNSFMINNSVSWSLTTNSIFATIALTSTRGPIAILSSIGTANQHFVSRTLNGSGRYYDSAGQEITASALPNGFNLIGIHENTSGITVFENGSNLVTNFAHDTGGTITGLILFRRDASDNNYMKNGSGFSELIVYGNSSKLSDNSGISNNINSYYSIYATDTDAQAFINAASITDGTQIRAIDALVTSLKSAGIWTKMKAIYPFVGGSATSHKFNLKDPRDLDAAYRLVFNGGWTHSSTGAKPNGTTGYANPFYTNVTDNSSMWYYSITNNTTNAVDMGVYNNPYSDTQISCYYGGTSWGLIRILSNGFTGMNWVATTSQGFFGANRTSSTLANAWYNGVKKGTNTNTSSQDAFTKSLFIGAYNSNAGAMYFSNRESAFVSIGDGLTDAEATSLYNAVQAYQTALGRAV